MATILEVVGWVGAGLLVISLLQAKMMRLRVLNLLACLILVAYNAIIGVWPMVGMNAAIAIIDVWFIFALLREAKPSPVKTHEPRVITGVRG